MDLGLAGKTAIVTGGGSNICRGVSLTLAEEKANVVIADLDVKQAEKVVGLCNQRGGKAIAVKCDVTSWDDVQGMVKKTIDTFGNLDILINGVGWVADKRFIEKPRDEWDKEIKLNYLSVINGVRAALDHMIQRQYGRIVSLISDAGRVGQSNESVYAGGKAAAAAFCKSIAQEVGRYNITLNMVSPGATIPTFTDDVGELSMHVTTVPKERYAPETMEKIAKIYPLRRLGKAQDIANAVVFLASDRASWITGQTLSVSGGWTMI